MRAAGKINPPIQDIAAPLNGNRRFGQHLNFKRRVVNAGNAFDKQDVNRAIRRCDKYARSLLRCRQTERRLYILLMHNLALLRIKNKKDLAIDNAVHESLWRRAQIRITLRTRKRGLVPFNAFGSHIQNVKRRLFGLLLAARARRRRRTAQHLAFRQRQQTHRAMLRQQIAVFHQRALLRLAIPEQQPAASISIIRRTGQHNRPAIGMGQQRVRSVDRGLALGEKSGIPLRIAFFSGRPGLRRIPFQQKSARITPHKKSITLPGHGIPLPVTGPVDPFIRAGIKTEKAHWKSRAPANRAIRSHRHAHQMRPLAGIIKRQGFLCAGFRIRHHQLAIHQVADFDALAIGKIPVKKALRTGDIGLFPPVLKRAHKGRLAPIARNPGVIPPGYSLSINLAILIAVNARISLRPFFFGNQRPGLPRLGVQRHDLPHRAAHAEIHPARIVGNHRARVLPPVLIVEMPVILKRTRARIK